MCYQGGLFGANFEKFLKVISLNIGRGLNWTIVSFFQDYVDSITEIQRLMIKVEGQAVNVTERDALGVRHDVGRVDLGLDDLIEVLGQACLLWV